MSDDNCSSDEDFKLHVHIEADDAETAPDEPAFTYGFPEEIEKNVLDKAADSAVPSNPGAPDANFLIQISRELERLSSAFESKFKYDAAREKIIDGLHQELQQYREGLLKKYLHRIIIDVIKIVDDIRKYSDHHKSQPPLPENADKILSFMDNIADDLEELFAWEGLTPFSGEGDGFDSGRQRIVNKIETGDPDLDKKIARHVRPGYEWEGKVIRPELVSVYIFNPDNVEKDKDA